MKNLLNNAISSSRITSTPLVTGMIALEGQDDNIPNVTEEFVFLGGTCNDSTWREKLIPLLKVAYFNPVISDWKEKWTPKHAEAEDNAKQAAAFNLFVITPKQKGFYSLVEMTYCACNSPDKPNVMILFLEEDGDKKFDEARLKSNNQIRTLLDQYEGTEFFDSLADVAKFLNKQLPHKETK
jgi:hypothetical protein